MGIKDMREDGFKDDEISILSYLDLRYLGQSYEITIPHTSRNAAEFSFITDFHKAHKRLYSYYHAQQPVEIVNIRVKAVGAGKKIKLKRKQLASREPESAFLKKQDLYYEGKKYEASVFKRSLLEPGNRINGSSLIVDFESTTFLPPSYFLEVDEFLNLLIHKRKKKNV